MKPRLQRQAARIRVATKRLLVTHQAVVLHLGRSAHGRGLQRIDAGMRRSRDKRAQRVQRRARSSRSRRERHTLQTWSETCFLACI